MENRFSMKKYSFSSILLLVLLMAASCKQKKAVVNQQSTKEQVAPKSVVSPVIPEDDTDGSNGNAATKTIINATKVESSGIDSAGHMDKTHPTQLEVAPHHGSPDNRGLDSIKNSYPPKPR